MLENLTQEELDKLAAECLAKYEKQEYDLIASAAGGKVATYAELLRALSLIDANYTDEAEDYLPVALPITGSTRHAALTAEDLGTPVADFAYQWLQFQQDVNEPDTLAPLGV